MVARDGVKPMTLDDVMQLEKLKLCEAVAEKMGWQRTKSTFLHPLGQWQRPDGKKVDCLEVPAYHRNWSAAMTVRDWMRRLPLLRQEDFYYRVWDATQRRLGRNLTALEVWLLAEPVDYARAALLVSVE